MLIVDAGSTRPVTIETVATQEYLTQDAERFMAVKRVNPTADKAARAYRLQAFLETGQIVFPDKSLVRATSGV